MNESHTEPRALSRAGDQRRQAILADAIRLGRRRRQKRRIVHTSLVIAPLLAVLVVASLFAPKRSTLTKVMPPSTSPRVTTTMPTSKDDMLMASNAVVRIERIADDPTIIARYATTERPSSIAGIDDQQLFKELAVANLRGGLATIDGHTRLILAP